MYIGIYIKMYLLDFFLDNFPFIEDVVEETDTWVH